jgi:hypothetical protein
MTRLNRLGFWNRLAIVAVALTMVGLPIWAVVDTNADAAKFATSSYRICTEIAEQYPTANPSKDAQNCMDQEIRQLHDMGATWGTYFTALGFTFVLCCLVYGLLLAIVSTSKWVWRGRSLTS